MISLSSIPSRPSNAWSAGFAAGCSAGLKGRVAGSPERMADAVELQTCLLAEEQLGPQSGMPNLALLFSDFGMGAPAPPCGKLEPVVDARGGASAAAAAVDLALSFEGEASQSLKGRLPGFTAPGGSTKNCAAFVSACLEATGALPKGGGSASVSQLRQKLVGQGWKRVSAAQAVKGSVWMTREGRGSHTELVSAPGGAVIGSNNTRPGFQKISVGHKDDASGEFYAPPGVA